MTDSAHQSSHNTREMQMLGVSGGCHSRSQEQAGRDCWRLTLYTAGRSPTTERAEAALRRLCERYVPGRYEIEVVDIIAAGDSAPLDILAVPTVVRTSPAPERRVVGDLSQGDRAASSLGLSNAKAEQ